MLLFVLVGELLEEKLTPRCESLAVICPEEGLEGQLMARRKKPGPNVADSPRQLMI